MYVNIFLFTHGLARIQPQAPYSRMGQSIQERLKLRRKYGELSLHLSQGQLSTANCLFTFPRDKKSRAQAPKTASQKHRAEEQAP